MEKAIDPLGVMSQVTTVTERITEMIGTLADSLSKLGKVVDNLIDKTQELDARVRLLEARNEDGE